MTPTFSAEQLAELRRSNEKLSHEMTAAFRQIGAAAVPIVRAFGECLQKIDKGLKQNYQAAGAPYGDTAEGRWRWLNEVADAANARRREINAVQREQDLADMRALGEKCGAALRANQSAQTNEGAKL